MLVGNSTVLREVRDQLQRYAPASEHVLLTGETGTGKELAARMLHEHSGRPGPFVAVDCGSIPPTLTEAILYGHERGSYTGASNSANGLFSQSNHGTLFLDEITNTTTAFQACLLRSLQERSIRRVGSNQEQRLNLRVVSATNTPLHKTKNDMFRQDLYYRLSTLEVTMPPLRDHPQDITPITHHLLERLNQHYGKTIGIIEEAINQLTGYDFPGNVRELENLLTRAYHNTSTNEILSITMPQHEHHQPTTGFTLPITDFWKEIAMPYHDHDLTRSDVKRLLHHALATSRGRYTEATTLLGVQAGEYKRFMDFLRRQNLQFDYRHYRPPP